MAQRYLARKGFSLLEMSIVLLIIAVVVGSGAAMFSASVKQQQSKETLLKMQAIQKALLDYRRAFNRIPCPADLALPMTDANFGVEAWKDPSTPTSTSCNGGVPAATYTDGGTLYEGAVPVKTLKLPDDYVVDGWGRRFDYAADGTLTAYNAFDTVAVNDTQVRFTIVPTITSVMTITSYPVYVLISYGEDGHGAFTREGSATILNTSNSDDQNENCDCDSSGNRNGAINSTFVQRPIEVNKDNPDLTFDDIVTYGARADLRSARE
jgi:prepilin-type N-terminal cleavage/methylation domain-containing protein